LADLYPVPGLNLETQFVASLKDLLTNKAPANGFDSLVTLSCTAPTGVTCAFNPTTVTPGAGAVTSMLTATTSPTVQRYGRLKLMGTLFSNVGLFGCFLVGAGKSRRGLYSLLLTGIAGTLIAGSLLASTGCGGGSQANRGTASIVVTATSGALSHSTTINLTVQ
jgi:trimeric autotransporter adhesin